MSAFIEYVPPPDGPFDPAAVVAACFEHGHPSVLIDRPALPPAFFDLSTGVAGDLAQRVALYGLRAAAVVPDVPAHSGPFQAFAREAGRGRALRLFPTRGAAAAWLAGD